MYTAPSLDAAEDRFDAFEAEWEPIYPAMIKAWRDAWDDFIPFLEFPIELRKIVYTTNSIESLNADDFGISAFEELGGDVFLESSLPGAPVGIFDQLVSGLFRGVTVAAGFAERSLKRNIQANDTDAKPTPAWLPASQAAKYRRC